MMSHSVEESHASRRNRSIRLAVITSFLSKAGTVLLQLLSIPIAVRVLGRDEFGLYATVNFTLGTISMLQVGVGPALAHGLTRARAAEDGNAQRELGSSAFFLMAGLALLAGILLAAVLLFVPIATLYGANYAGRESSLRPALWIGLCLFLLILVLNLTERVREGHLEVASNNLWGAAGNVLAALLVGAGVWWVPQVWFLVVAVYGALVLAKIGNTLALWRQHPLMRPRSGFFRPVIARHLLTDGLIFSICCLLPGLAEFNYCGWLVGRMMGLSEVALYSIFISLTTMQLGFVIMLSAPTWPTVAEALARGDVAWARKAAGRLYLFGTAFAFCSALGLVLLGPWVLPLWLGREFAGIGRPLLACYGLYFIAHVWRHLNHTMMIGTGQVSKIVRIQLLESAVVAVAAWFALGHGGIPAQFVAMGIVILVLTGTFLPRQVARVLRKTPGVSPA
jgi:O-antigen/teichoic acid export membrane protein